MSNFYLYSNAQNLSTSETQKINIKTEEIAKNVTIRILTKSGSGSGVIIKRKGQTYIALTNHHVVADSPEHGYQVMTVNGKMYPARELNHAKNPTLDLALVEFTSQENYQVVQLQKSRAIIEGERVYASGFPAWHFTWQGKKIIRFEETRNWGIRAFKLTTGIVKLQLPKTFPGGYQVGYTNDVSQGMSGGPVLNQKGELIAINGLLKYPFQGINAFTFADGSVPNKQLYLKIDPLSWAIPINKVIDFIETQNIQQGGRGQEAGGRRQGAGGRRQEAGKFLQSAVLDQTLYNN
ncbi:serine protease [Cronbergia sp. UHCC 0137]|uniref:S1 family peptidase n=1 Tax=Cronbergia sp. UHCC 0137 TaxID=3110239 RepID=UPI002B2142B6|nr:serine protease [Cronbergia sp. UHCC 0137]MEA5618593.1 serine protease [Cronbergia sp. UHCC 0137]